MLGINQRHPTEGSIFETDVDSLRGPDTSKGDSARTNRGLLFALILLISSLMGLPSMVLAQGPDGAKFVITEDSGDRTRVEWYRSGQPMVRLSIDNGYLDKFRGSVGRVTQTNFIVLFAERNNLAPFFQEPVARARKARRLAVRITLYADDSVDVHWSVWNRYSASTILNSGLIARRYNQNLLQLSIEQIRSMDLLYVPPHAKGLVDKGQFLWDHFDVFIFDVRGRSSAFNKEYIQCVGPPTVRANPMHRCQLRANYRDLTVRADLSRRSLEDTEPFEVRLRQILDALFAP